MPVLYAALALWLGLLAVSQIVPGAALAHVAKAVSEILLTRWHLFTADISQLEAALYLRDLHDDGSTSAWREATLTSRGPGLRLSFADRRAVYAFLPIANGLMASTAPQRPNVSQRDAPHRMMADPAYRMLLQYTRSQPAGPTVTARQFLLASRVMPEKTAPADLRAAAETAARLGVPGDRSLVRLVSPFHPLAGAQRPLQSRARPAEPKAWIPSVPVPS